MYDKADLIYRGALIILFIALLTILYRYSENGRYTYYSHIYSDGEDRYVVDRRTGIIYGNFRGTGDAPSYSYKTELLNGKELTNIIVMPTSQKGRLIPFNPNDKSTKDTVPPIK